VLKWAREHHCPWDWTTCALAAKHGQLEVLKWALERGCPRGAGTLCAYAAVGGQLEVLTWLREHDYPWDGEITCAAAAQGGQNLSALCGIGDARRGCVSRVKGVLGGVLGV